ncbi:MAG TPA: peptidylprolyl isomerase [Candidatus Dormibacteraeota bacterium]|nr:peptidylprolyl isomerase [Candidatus Dormibacteraeota bacterium]
MRKLAVVFIVGSFALATQTRAQTFAQTPVKPKTIGNASAAPTYDRTLLRPTMLREQAPETYQVKFETTRGDFVMTVTRAWAPIGADRFYNLVKHHFYDNMVVFRAVPGFVVQFGISSYPAVSSAWRNANIKDDRVTQSNKRGFVTYAKTSAPNSRSTQIFINFKDNSFLDSQGFAPFGVIDAAGMKVVEMLYDQYGDQPTSEQDQIERAGKAYLDSKYPKLDVIKHATLVSTAEAAPAVAKPQ